MNMVISPLRPQMKSLEVANLHEALVFLGFTIDEGDGANRRFGRSTRAAVIAFQTARGLPANGMVDEATATAINQEIASTSPEIPGGGDLPVPKAPTENVLFGIEGEVVKPDGSPLQNYRVRAFDRALCTWRPLGEGRTGDDGLYRITYDPAQLQEWGKSRADLRVEVLPPVTPGTPPNEEVLATSALILQALRRETVNFSIGTEVYRGVDEFTRVERALAPQLQGHQDWNCLETADILILAREAKLRASLVAHYVKAQRWQATYNAPAAAFYALLRRGESTQIDAVLARPLIAIWSALVEAKRANIINLTLDHTTRAELAELQQRYLARPDHPYAHLVGTTSLSAKQRLTFTSRLTSGELAGEQFWQALEADGGFTGDQVGELRDLFELQAFTDDNTSLTLRLRSGLAVRTSREVAAFSLEHWRDGVLDPSVVIPDDVLPRSAPAERRAAYARMLYVAAEQQYPTTHLAAQMSRRAEWTENPLLVFFTAHPDFEFRDQRVLQYLTDNPKALDGLPDRGAARDDLLRVEQLFHLVPSTNRLGTIQPLWDAGLRAAPQIAYLGRQNLHRRTGGALASRLANQIYRKAVHVTSLALNVYLRYHPRLNSLSLTALQMPQRPASAATSALAKPQPDNQDLAKATIAIPEWEELFGSPDACECAHNESALSPAAYLVDTMAFLQRAVDTSGNNALDELLARRPDLGTLQLTSENTDTELPHIDLVIEMLEAIVTSADGKTLSPAAIGPTTWDSDLLAAQPEHLEPAAYEIARTAIYPFDHLPFDLWAEEGRRYLVKMGIARDELMRVMPTHHGVGQEDIAAEALGMSGIEQALICQPSLRPNTLAERWGFKPAQRTRLDGLGSLESQLERAHLEYDPFLRLLNTRYVNPGRGITVSFGDTPCAIAGAVLHQDGSPLTGPSLYRFLDRLNRFLRLQRRLGRSEYELDGLIAALGVADFDAPAFIPSLADVQALRKALGLGLSELSAWWAERLDTYAFDEDAPSQYEAIFLDAAVFPDTHTGTGPDLRNEVFALTADRSDLVITTSTDASLSRWLAVSDGEDPPTYTLEPAYAAHIQSATGLTADDLHLLVATDLLPKDAGGEVVLNLPNVSLLYRVASLGRAFEIGMADLVHLVAILNVTPVRTHAAAAGPAQSRRFFDSVQEMRAGKRSVEELAYLLLHDDGAAAALAPALSDIDAWFEATSPSFAGILATDDSRITSDVKASVTQSLGSSLGVDPQAADALLFVHRKALGEELLAHLIAAANPDATALPVLHEDRVTTFGRVQKFSLAWNALGLDLSFLPFVLDRGPKLEWADIAALPMSPRSRAQYESWNRLVTAAALQNSTFTVEQSLFGLLDTAAAAQRDPATFVLADFLAQLSEWSEWPLADVTYLSGPKGFDLTLPADMQDERALVSLQRVFDRIRTSGAGAEQVHSWTIAELGFAETQSIRQALAVAYAHDTWLGVLGSVQDELRSLKRDALLGYLLNTLNMEDADAFYRHYLIDPGYAPCARTSRIVQAHAAVQVFAQRILLNLELFGFERADAEAWQWRKKYRVWEAARRIFLYPQNWLEPEWRDNKSAFCKELEDGLLQDDVTHETAERLYLEYLHKVDDVSQLEIMGMYLDENAEEEVETLHVFGRTQDSPHQYFYRRWEDRATWTPWERVDQDIDADHLAPVVSDGRLYVFWPEFSISDNPNAVTTTTTEVVTDPERAAELEGLIRDHQQRIDEIDGALAAIPPHKQEQAEELEAERAEHDRVIDEELQPELDALTVERDVVDIGDRYLIELGLNWSEYREGRWTAKRTSNNKITYTTSDVLARHYFTGWVGDDGVLRVSARINKVGNGEGVTDYRSPEGYIGYFYFDQCGGHLLGTTVDVTDPTGEVSVVGAVRDFHATEWFNTWWSNPSLELEIDGAADTRVLVTSGGRLHYAHQYGQYGTEVSLCFFSDGARTYFVEPLPDVRLKADFAISELGLLTRRATEANGPDGAAVDRDARLSRMALTSGSSPVVDQHYNTPDTGLIVDRTIAGVAASSYLDDINDTLAKETTITTVAGAATIATGFRYKFTRFHHPHTCLLLKQHYRYGIDGVLNPDPAWGEDSAEVHRQLMPSSGPSFEDTYSPNPAWVYDNFGSELLEEAFDFDHGSACGPYHWELFFHVPILIATRLMQNQRFAEARRWFHYVFDPTTTATGGPERFWKIKPFYEEQQNGSLPTLQSLLTEGDPAYERQVQEWEGDPFQPHAIARLRITAYMQFTVTRYVRCLINEADVLFTRDTREDVDEAASLYLLAAEILGERPTVLPAQESTTSTPNLMLGRFRQILDGLTIDDLLTPLVSWLSPGLSGLPGFRTTLGTGRVSSTVGIGTEVEVHVPSTGMVPAQGGTSSVDTLLLFCLPIDDVLYGYWDMVADRLFKIRHCMNIQGQVRQLALYQPPIDPALLVRASAAGLSIETIIAGLYAPLPNYRFTFMLQKALELCNEARGFGAALLAALEKKDSEQMALLRSTHEIGLLDAIHNAKKKSVEEADSSLASLTKSRESAERRATFYSTLERISAGEQKSLDKLDASRNWQMSAELTESLASILHAIPTASSGGPQFGGPHLGSAAQAVAAGLRGRSSALAHEASRAGTNAGYTRRQKEWTLQADLARNEIEQIDKQIIAADIRKQIVEVDLANHVTQTAQSREVEELLRLKFTNEQLQSWMISKLSSVYFQAYQMAYQLAVQAEAAFRHELGPDERSLTFIQPTNWDTLQKGLLAGELLQQQLRQIEKAYIGANARELEITKHVSLFQLDPAALLELRQKGTCDFHVPEVLFNLDFASHYFRRIKSVRLTIPSVVGPYINVSATLTLTGSWTRTSGDPADATQPVRDAVVSPQTAIATSSGNQDGGVFELTFSDARYLPFEGAGAISSWRLELPSAIRPFDYTTISDVIMHVSHTARDGGDVMKASVNEGILPALNDLDAVIDEDATMSRLFSVRREFPGAWNQLLGAGQEPTRTCTFQLTKQHFPSFLTHLWQTGLNETVAPTPITLDVKGFSAFLSPRGPLPLDADTIVVNQQTWRDTGLGIPAFDLLNAPGALSSMQFDNASVVDCELTINGTLRAEDWNDLYLLMVYEVSA
ncbi:MAG: neuraminidase-like domain-containing protein [Chromatiales bacterium]